MLLNNWIATVILSSNLNINKEKDPANNPIRILELENIVRSILDKISGDGVILFPAGWVHTQYNRAEIIYPEIEEKIKQILVKSNQNIKVCIGIDGFYDRPIEDDPYDKDQMAITIDKTGIIAIARKYYPTDANERKNIILAKDYLEGEREKPRIFQLNGINYYPFVCYDIYGPYHDPSSKINPNVQIGLNLIHRIRPSGEFLSQENYFPLNGWSETSFQWQIPIFGTTIFFRRPIPSNWPTGIFWMLGEKWRKPKYREISLAPDLPKILIEFENEYAEVRIFSKIPERVKLLEESLNLQPFKRITPKKIIENNHTSVFYDMLRNQLDKAFSSSVIDQSKKFTYRRRNTLGYPRKTELDMVSLSKPSSSNVREVKFRIYPYVLAGYLNLKNPEEIITFLPAGSVLKYERENPHPAEVFIAGSFSNENEIERFLNLIRPEM